MFDVREIQACIKKLSKLGLGSLRYIYNYITYKRVNCYISDIGDEMSIILCKFCKRQFRDD